LTPENQSGQLANYHCFVKDLQLRIPVELSNPM